MAPEETKTTRWPSARSLRVVSTITERIERSGSWVVSETMELVPVGGVRVYIGVQRLGSVDRESITKFDYYCEVFLHIFG
jgi:hypothetical protein